MCVDCWGTAEWSLTIGTGVVFLLALVILVISKRRRGDAKSISGEREDEEFDSRDRS